MPQYIETHISGVGTPDLHPKITIITYYKREDMSWETVVFAHKPGLIGKYSLPDPPDEEHNIHALVHKHHSIIVRLYMMTRGYEIITKSLNTAPKQVGIDKWDKVLEGILNEQRERIDQLERMLEGIPGLDEFGE